jgi:hypothetical protein
MSYLHKSPPWRCAGFLVCEKHYTQNCFVIQLLQIRFTLMSQSHSTQKPIIVPLIRTRLSKETLGLVAGVYDEVVEACNQYIPVKDGNFLLSLVYGG